MASAQIWRNSDSSWIPPLHVDNRDLNWILGITIWKTGASSTVSILLVWNFFHNATYYRQQPLSCAYMPYSVPNWILSLCSEASSKCICTALSPSRVTLLSSWKVHMRKFQVFADLRNVIALVIAPWSMRRNTEFASHWDVKGPSSAEKWYGRSLIIY